MKRVLILLSLLFCNVVFADTINLHWRNYDGTTYQDSTCTVNGDLNIPTTPPTKYGYTFTGWKMSNYQPIEYLESTGTQWIDTKVRPSKDTKIEIDLQLNATYSGKYIFGSWAQGGGQYYLYISSDNWQWGWSSDYITTSTAANTNKHKFTLFSDKGISYIVLDNNTIGTATTQSQVYGANFLIFTGVENGSIQSSGIPQKIYSCKIYENSTLIRDFIPVLDKDGIPCMFDKVESKFYYNQGTGQFVAGPALQ